MNSVKKKWYVYLALMLLCLFIFACSNTNRSDEENEGNNNGNEVNAKPKIVDEQVATADAPITITVAYPWGEDQFDDRFGPIDEKFEELEIEFASYDGSSESLQEMFAAEIVPDIIVSSPTDIVPLEEADAIFPLNDLVEQEGFDLDRINPALISLIKGFDSEERLIGLPDGTGLFGLYYNKEVFDLFGVDYPDPDEPMTWEEVLDIASKMTREHNGQEYLGLEFGGSGSVSEIAEVPLKQLATSMTDPETGEVLITEKPEFTSYLELMEEYYSIPGMRSETALENDMFAQKRAAMTINWHNYLAYGWGDTEYIRDMDVAPVPVWEDKPDTGPYLGTATMVVTTYSENKVSAFRVLEEYLSNDNQVSIAKTMASGPAVIETEVIEAFGESLEEYETLDTSVFFKLEGATFDEYSHFDRYVDIDLEEFSKLDIDINTFLRKTKEEAEATITDALESK